MALAALFGPEEIEWVFLDAYSTIMQEDHALLVEACHEMARSTRGRHADAEIGDWWEERFHSLCEGANGDRFVVQREIVARSLGETVRHFRAEIDQGRWLEALFRYAVRPVLHHDARAFLLGVGAPVCIVSNIDRDDFLSAADYTGLSFAQIVTSEEARSYKPDAAIFREALRRTGAPPERVLHVGDSFRADVVGATGVGLRVAWLNRRGSAPPAGATARPTVEVSALVELLAPPA